MSASTASDTTLLAEHFSYRPIAIVDDIINSINILAFKATDAVERGLLSANPSDLGFAPPKAAAGDAADVEAAAAAAMDKAALEIESGVHQLETLLESKIDKNFDKMELYALRNILSVPPDVRDWVRLSHYEGLDFNSPAVVAATSTAEADKTSDADATAPIDDVPSLESIALQRRKLRETMKLHALLKAETERNQRTINELRALLGKGEGKGQAEIKTEDKDGEDSQMGNVNNNYEKDGESIAAPFAFLQHKGENLTGDANRPLTTTTSFTLSQLSALRTSLQTLGPRLASLAQPLPSSDPSSDPASTMVGAAHPSDNERSWRQQRLEFVELEARRHLEGVRGLELGDMGEIRDGEWQGEGRKLGMGEVEDLERVVVGIAPAGSTPAAAAQSGIEAGERARGTDGDDTMDETA